jgi:hypothetical protein
MVLMPTAPSVKCDRYKNKEEKEMCQKIDVLFRSCSMRT